MPKTLDGYHLKWIAAVSMLLDHCAVILLEPAAAQNPWIACLNQCLRIAGRLAFPLYGFLLVQGFLHTGNLRRYLLRLLTLGMLSEIPYDLAFSGTILEFQHNNVFFTLFLGLLGMACIAFLKRKAEQGSLPRTAAVCLMILTAAVLCGAAERMHTDYGGAGVLTVLTLYFLRKRPSDSCLAAAALLTVLLRSPVQAWSMGSAIPAAMYTGSRGRSGKIWFYSFYPAHLLALYAAAKIFGI